MSHRGWDWLKGQIEEYQENPARYERAFEAGTTTTTAPRTTTTAGETYISSDENEADAAASEAERLRQLEELAFQQAQISAQLTTPRPTAAELREAQYVTDLYAASELVNGRTVLPPTLPSHETLLESALNELARRRARLERQRPRGGGGGRAEMRFDQAAIQENIRNQWRFLMLEEPSNLNGLVAEYVSASRSMGMALNLGAWITQRARADGRYQLLYGRKPAELSEEEYIGSLRGVTEQLGLSSRGSRQQIEAAAGSGQTAAGFARRAGETREARSSNLGLFSRKVAQAFNSLGSLGRGA